MFGHPNNRERIWRVCWDEKLRVWSLKYSIQDLANLLLLPPTAPLKLDYKVYLTPASTSGKNVQEDELTKWLCLRPKLFVRLFPRSQAVHLERFRTHMPAKRVYDLSANVEKRRRCETQDNMLPCLTTSSQLWQLGEIFFVFKFPSFPFKLLVRYESHGRLLLGREQLGALGYPCIGAIAAGAHVAAMLNVRNALVAARILWTSAPSRRVPCGR